jgi:hypothetical protein
MSFKILKFSNRPSVFFPSILLYFSFCPLTYIFAVFEFTGIIFRAGWRCFIIPAVRPGSRACIACISFQTFVWSPAIPTYRESRQYMCIVANKKNSKKKKISSSMAMGSKFFKINFQIQI